MGNIYAAVATPSNRAIHLGKCALDGPRMSYLPVTDIGWSEKESISALEFTVLAAWCRNRDALMFALAFPNDRFHMSCDAGEDYWTIPQEAWWQPGDPPSACKETER